jgi:3-oxoacyl-[acyl-carrier-protein] synthase II
MAILGAYLALEDAGRLEMDLREVGIVIATGYGACRTTFGFLDSVIDDGDSCASPTLFSSSVHNAAAANVSITLKASGPCLTVSQFEMSIPSALLSACQWLSEGRVEWVLFGGIDEYCDVLGYCLHRFMDEQYDSSKTPMELSNKSPGAGEGTAFFLLTPYNNKKPSKYGSIIDVQLGSLRREKIPLAEDAVVLMDMGIDGGCKRYPYFRFIRNDVETSSYNSLYGILPIGPAFDMAIASLSIKEDTIFISEESSGITGSLSLIREDRYLGSRPISCVKLGREGEFGVVTLARE